MRTKLKRTVAAFLAAMLIMQNVPFGVLAEEIGGEEGSSIVADATSGNATSGAKSAPEGENKTTPKGENKTTPEGENKTTPEGENKTTPEGENKTTPEGENKTTPEGENKTTPEGENKTTPEGENKTTPEGENKTAPEGENKTTPEGEDELNKKPEGNEEGDGLDEKDEPEKKDEGENGEGETAALSVTLTSEAESVELGKSLNVVLTISGGEAPYTVELNGEQQEAAEAGTITCTLTPEEIGTFTAHVKVTDAKETSKEAELTVEVTEAEEANPAEEWLAKAKAVGLSGDWRRDLVAVAASQVGYTVTDGECIYGDAASDWSSAFVSWCLDAAGISASFPRAGSAGALKSAMESASVYHGASEAAPKAGDLVFLDTDGNGSADRVAVVTSAGLPVQAIVGCGDSVLRTSYAGSTVLGISSTEELMIRAGLLKPKAEETENEEENALAQELAEILAGLESENAELYAQVMDALKAMVGTEVTDVSKALSTLSEEQLGGLFLILINSQDDQGELLTDPINLNSAEFAPKTHFYIEYMSADGWTLLNGQALNGDEHLRLNVSFNSIDALDLKAAGYIMTYQAQDILRTQATSGNMISKGVNIGNLNVDASGLVTINLDHDWVDNQIKRENGQEVRGGLLEGDFKMNATLNIDEVIKHPESDIVIGGINLHFKDYEHLAANAAEVHVSKENPTLRKGSDGEYYLDYELTVTAGKDHVPGVKVEDYFVDGNGNTTAALNTTLAGIIDGRDDTLYGYLNATQTSSANPDVGQPSIAVNAAKHGITWTIGDMNPNEVRTLRYSLKLKSGVIGNKETPTLDNNAEVYAENIWHEDDTANFHKQASADVRKTSKVFGTAPNEKHYTIDDDGYYLIEYTVTLTANANNPYDMTDTVLRDVFTDRTDDPLEQYITYCTDEDHPITLRYPKHDGTNGTETVTVLPDGNKIVTTVPRLAAGETATLTYTMRVDPAAAAASNGNIMVRNRAQAWDHSNNDLSQCPYYSYYDSDVSIDSKQWARKVASQATTSEQTLTASGELYDATGSGISKMGAASEDFAVPAGSFRYNLVVNETGDYNIGQLSMTDTLAATGGVNYLAYTGFVKVEAFEMPENTVISGDAYNYVGAVGTPVATRWVKVEGKTSFSYTPVNLGLPADSNYALRMTYYAKPQNNNNIVRVTANNSFGVSGTAIGPGGPVTISGVNQSVNVTVSGAQEYRVAKEAWYYDLNPTPGFENGSIYWAIKIDSKELKEGLVIQDSANIGSTSHNTPSQELYMVRMNLGDRKVRDAFGSIDELKAAYPTPVNISEYCDVAYVTTGGGAGKDMNFRFKKTMKLEGEESLYIILRTTPNITVPDRNSHSFTNKLNLSYNGGKSWDNVHPQDTITIPSSDGIMKASLSTFVMKADGSVQLLSGTGANAYEYLRENHLTGVFVSWLVKVNYSGTLAGDYTVIDQIPDGLEPIFARNKWVGGGYNGTAESSRPQLAVMPAAGYTHGSITSGTDNGVNRTSNFYINGQQLMFRVANLQAGRQNDAYSVDVQVMCRVTDPDVLTSGQAKSFRNVAELVNKDGVRVDRASSAQTVQAPSVSKNGRYAQGDGSEYPFELKVNQGASDLVKGGDTIVLIDEMKGPMTFMPESLYVIENNSAQGQRLPESEYNVSVEQTTENNQPVTILKITLPDNKALTVNYKCMVNAKPDTPVSISNVAHWEGQPAAGGSSVNNPSFQYSAEGQILSGTAPHIKVTKVDGKNYGQKLAGAVFEIAPVNMVNGVPVADESAVHTHTTNNEGTFTCLELNHTANIHFEYNTVYAIRETQAPDGYMLDNTWRYWMVLKKNANDGTFPAVPAGVLAYTNDLEFPLTVYNYKYSAVVRKNFSGTPVNGTYTFGITDTISNGKPVFNTSVNPNVTITYPTETEAEFIGLVPDKDYYIYEIDENGQAILPKADGAPSVGAINGKLFEVSYSGGNVVNVTGQTVTGAKPTVTVSNSRALIDIPVTKTWVDGDNQDGLRPNSITVSLKSGTDANHLTSTGKELTLTAQNNWSGTFAGLEKYTSDGAQLHYAVDENAVPGYEKTIDGYHITNTHTPEAITISGTKIWEDGNNADGKRPQSIVVHLHTNGVHTANEPKVTVRAEDNWTWSFENLPKYADGREIIYTFVEEEIQEYTTYYSLNDIINRYSHDKVNVTVSKAWSDAGNQDGIRPQFVTVVLVKNGVDTDQTLTLSAANNWQGTFEDLDKNQNGAAIRYTVKELNVPEGYTASYNTPQHNVWAVTNTHTPETVHIAGSKTWDDAGAEQFRPESITIYLHVNGVVPEPAANYTKVVTKNNNWAWDFGNLPKYADGQEIVYTISEDSVEDYTTSVNGYNVTNSYNPGKISIEVTKSWNDNNNQDGLQPSSVRVNLLANGQPTDQHLILSDMNHWQGEFTDLVKYRNGELIEYTITEDEVTGYTPEISGDDDHGFTIVNTHTPETVNVTGSKTWVGGENDRPASITVQLHADGVFKDSMTITPDAAGKWPSWNFENLPKYAGGKAIVYTVTESELPNYTSHVNGFNVTNTYTPGKTSVDVSKVWLDNNNQDGKRPTSITVTLLANGEPTDKTLTLSAANLWQGSFEDLDMTDSTGAAIQYSVSESEVVGYTSNLIGTAANGFTFTNAHTPETVSVSGTKTWDDANNQDHVRPSEITVELYANGKRVQTAAVNAAKKWAYSFDNLPKYEGGKEIVYTIGEVAVEGYTPTINGFDITNSRTPNKVSVEVRKHWEDNQNQDGIRPLSVTVHLLANGLDTTQQKVLNQANNWHAIFTDLDENELDSEGNSRKIVYTVTEDAVTGYDTVITGSASEGFTVTNSHNPALVSVSGTKTWVEDPVYGIQKPASITIHLHADNVHVDSVNVTEADSWAWSFDNLPKYSEGREIVYAVREDTIEDFTTVISGYNVTNTYTPGKTSLLVAKAWEDANDQDGLRPGSVTVRLYQNGQATDKTLILNASNNWRGIFDNLLEEVPNSSVKYFYTVQEEATPGEKPLTGYTTTISGSMSTGYTVINTHIPETVSVSGTKVWDDDGNRDNKRPASIKIHLHANNVHSSSEPQQTVTAAPDGSWSWTFENLPKFANGQEISYSFVEEPVEGYTTEYSLNQVINHYSPEKVSVTVNKAWDDDNNRDGIRPQFITVVLVKDGTDTSQTLTLSTANNWQGSFTNLDKNEDGEPIVYTVRELDVTGYTPTYTNPLPNTFGITNTHIPETVRIAGSKTWVDTDPANRPASIKIHLHIDGAHPTPRESYIKEVTAADNWSWDFGNLPKFANGKEIVYTVTEEAVRDYTATVSGYDVTNTYNPGKISIEVSKSWSDGNNQDGMRPSSVEVELLSNGQPTGETLTLSSVNNWQGEFTDLVEYYGGEKVQYTVSERTVNGYIPYITGDDNIGFTITNAHTPETVDVTGSKTWVGGENDRPDSITVHLHANGAHKDSVTITPDAEGKWPAWSFKDLPKFENGKLITYTVVETDVPNYSASVTGYDITNTYTPGKTSIEVSKVWLDNGNQDGKRPVSITVTLLANGEPTTNTLTLSAANLWQGSFENLDIKDASGRTIAYSVSESEVPGYTSSLTGTAANGFTFTNTHTPETTSVFGTKTWQDVNNQDGKRPAAITVELFANGKMIDSVQVNASKNWAWAFNNLPKYEAGQEIVYTIGEAAVEGYTPTIRGYNITNSYTPGKVFVEVEKNWEDNHNQDGIRPESVLIHLMADGKNTGLTKELNIANGWQAIFTDLDEYKDGKKIEYTVTEDAVEGYTTVITGSAAEGYEVTNSHTPERISVSGSKTWVEDPVYGIKYPESINIHLHADNVHIGNAIVTAQDGWKWSFDNLPKYSEGSEILYTIHESAVEDFTPVVSGFNVTNTYTPGKTSVSVSKAWEDANNQDGLRPGSVTVRLYRDDAATDRTLVLNAENKWSGIFDNLLEKKNSTESYVYTVKEETNAEGYTSSITGSMSGGYTITNTHTPSTVSVTGTKTWVDANNRDGKRPASITVYLHANGLKVDTQTVTPDASGIWAWNFENLPEFSNGKQIVYTVTEEAVEGYTATANGYDLTNTYNPGKVSIPVEKFWNDHDNQDGIRPESVTVVLYADGVKTEKALILSAANRWLASFNDLDEYREGQVGQKIVYTVDELPVEGYTTVVTGDAAEGFTVTNSHTPDVISVSVTKVWDDMNDHDGVRPESIRVWLKADGVRVDSVVLNAQNQWQHTFTNLHKHKSQGTAVVYSVEEETVAGYTADVSASADNTEFVIVNSHNIQKVGSLKISKTVTGNRGSRTKEFTFKVEFDAPGSYPMTGDVTGFISNGDTVKLKHGQSVIISGLPSDVIYRVTESDNFGYRVSATGDTGTIKRDTVTVAAFVNSRSSVPATGDNIFGWFAAMGASFLGMAMLMLPTKRRRNRM